jgi:hypothetical protein
VIATTAGKVAIAVVGLFVGVVVGIILAIATGLIPICG